MFPWAALRARWFDLARSVPVLLLGNLRMLRSDELFKTSARGMIEEDESFCFSTFSEADGAIAVQHRVLVILGRARGERSVAHWGTLYGKISKS